MMKYLFYVVVIANLCFFLWEVQQGGLARFSPPPATDKGEKQILLLSELKEQTIRETPNNKTDIAVARAEGNASAGIEKLGERLADDLSATKLFKQGSTTGKDDRQLAVIDSMLEMEFKVDKLVQADSEDISPPKKQTSFTPETDMPAMEAETIPQQVASLQESQKTSEQIFRIDAEVKATDNAADEPSDNENKLPLAIENEVVTPITPKIDATSDEGGEKETKLSVSEENVKQADQLAAVSEEDKPILQKIDETAKEAAAVEANVFVPDTPPETVEQDNVPDEADKTAKVVANCREIGPFNGNRSMQNWLNGRNIDRNNAGTVYREVPISTSWIVVYPAGETMADSRQNLDMLKKKGVNDLWLFRKGPMQGMISLGLFSKQSRAEKLRQQLAGKNIAAEIKERHKTERRLFARIKQEIEIKQTEGLEVFDCLEQNPEPF